MAPNNLQGTHYSQQSREVKGFQFNLGEDALPFVCDEFLLVADGLGGDGHFVHTRMNPSMWNKEERRRLFEVPEDDEVLRAYFDGLFVEIDRDAENGEKPLRFIEVPKYEPHSGYYGSRFAAYAFVYLMRRDERFSPQTLFRVLDGDEDEKQRQAHLQAYASELCESLMGKIKELASLGGFELEDDRPSAKLLPTTLSAALYRDIGEETQVICLWAGDSRVVAQLADGCVQLTADDEKDEGMTNLLSLSVKSHINVKEYRFKRPFALFAVSDGTFDEMGGNLCFEAMVVLDPMGCDTQEDMQSIWKNLFSIRSTDDSATVAYYFFGMDSMEASRRFTADRIDEINKKYLDKLPELFDADFVVELQRLKRRTKNALRPFQDAIKADSHVIESFMEDERKTPSPSYAKALEKIDGEKRGLDDQKSAVYAQIRAFFEDNWLRLRPISENRHLNEQAQRLQDAIIKRDSCMDRYKKKLEAIKHDAEKTVEELSRQMDQGIQAADKGIVYCSPDGIQDGQINGIVNYLSSLVYSLRNYSRGCWDESREYAKHARNAARDQSELLRYEADALEKMAQQAAFEEDPAFVANLPETVRQCRQELRRLEEKKQELEETKETALADAAKKRAEGSMGSILDDLINGTGLLERLSDGLRAKLQKILDDYHAEADTLKSKSQLQTQIFAECDEHYMRFIQED